MTYRFALEQQDATDFSAGRVLYSLPGHPAFPVRLASEMFLRCLAARGGAGGCTLYDPCCGGAYHLTALAFLHREAIQTILASDINEDALGLARRNLSLLSVPGLERRESELARLYQEFGKDSHRGALESAARLRGILAGFSAAGPVPVRCFQADATRAGEIQAGLNGQVVDIVLTDLPYGRLSTWQGAAQDTGETPAWRMLEALRGVLSPHSLLAIGSDKAQKIAHPAYRRVEKFQVGRRQVVILTPYGGN